MTHQSVWKRAGLVLAIGFGVLGAVGPTVPAAAAGYAVGITGLNGQQAYNPDSQTVAPGDTVTWTNNDPQANHNAVCGTSDGCPADMAPNGGKLYKQGESASFTFRYSGTYNYHCVAHKGMTGTIVVTGDVHPPAAGSSGSGTGSTPAAATGSGSTSGAGTTGTPTGASRSTARPATSAGGPALDPSANDTASTSAAVRQSLVGVTLPRPTVTIKSGPDTRTPSWVTWVAGAALILSGILFALAWFGPPRRRRAPG